MKFKLLKFKTLTRKLNSNQESCERSPRNHRAQDGGGSVQRGFLGLAWPSPGGFGAESEKPCLRLSVPPVTEQPAEGGL